MKSFNIKRIAAVLCILLLTLSGCTKTQTRTVAGDVTGQGVSIDREADTQDVITLSMSMAKTLNPLVNSDESVD